jgi:hypothetical protein
LWANRFEPVSTRVNTNIIAWSSITRAADCCRDGSAMTKATSEHPDAQLAGDKIKMATLVRGGHIVIDGVMSIPIADQPTQQRISRNCLAGLG